MLTNDSTHDNAEAMRKIDKFPMRDAIKQELDPKFQPPAPSVLERILPKS